MDKHKDDPKEDEELLSKLKANLLTDMPIMDPLANSFGIFEDSKLVTPIQIKQANARMAKWKYMLENQAAFSLKSPQKCN